MAAHQVDTPPLRAVHDWLPLRVYTSSSRAIGSHFALYMMVALGGSLYLCTTYAYATLFYFSDSELEP
eukprot:689517-Pyramimonas_sp.AAC.2